ncbi:MAG: DinB family protein [Microthrixaceae bacterium]
MGRARSPSCGVRDHTEALAAPLGPEDQVVQSMPDASPTKWHRAHTTWFFEEFVLDGTDGYERFDEDFGYLFNSHEAAPVPVSPGPRRMITRPTVEEVGAYRQHVDSAMCALLSLGRPGAGRPPRGASGCHEQQHQELLLMDALHLLAQNPTSPVYGPRPSMPTGATPARRGLIEHEGGPVEIGRDSGDTGFGYDNESPRHTVLAATLRPGGLAGHPAGSGSSSSRTKRLPATEPPATAGHS